MLDGEGFDLDVFKQTASTNEFHLEVEMGIILTEAMKFHDVWMIYLMQDSHLIVDMISLFFLQDGSFSYDFNGV